MFLATSFVAGSVNHMVRMNTSKIAVSKPLGGAFLVFAGRYGGEIKKNELTSEKELKVEGCVKGAKIISYTLEVTKKGKKSSMDASSNMLSNDMVAKLQSLEPGDTFEFKGIRAYLAN